MFSAIILNIYFTSLFFGLNLSFQKLENYLTFYPWRSGLGDDKMIILSNRFLTFEDIWKKIISWVDCWLNFCLTDNFLRSRKRKASKEEWLITLIIAFNLISKMLRNLFFSFSKLKRLESYNLFLCFFGLLKAYLFVPLSVLLTSSVTACFFQWRLN